jgi:pyrroline-5-carboxylate reductase
MTTYTMSFIGAGKIAEVWIERLVRTGTITAERIMACDPSASRLEQLRTQYPGLKAADRNFEGGRFGHIIVIATPPPDVVRVLGEIRPALARDTIIISVAAGVPLYKLNEASPDDRTLRVMPNTPSMVGEGMNLVCFSPNTPDECRNEVATILAILGQFAEVNEAEIEAWGALCAVGPTYLFPIVESLIASAVDAGLAPEPARKAVAQLFIGTGRLIAATDQSVPVLNNMIGLHTLRESEAKQLFRDAYREALAKLQGLAARMAGA